MRLAAIIAAAATQLALARVNDTQAPDRQKEPEPTPDFVPSRKNLPGETNRQFAERMNVAPQEQGQSE